MPVFSLNTCFLTILGVSNTINRAIQVPAVMIYTIIVVEIDVSDIFH